MGPLSAPPSAPLPAQPPPGGMGPDRGLTVLTSRSTLTKTFYVDHPPKTFQAGPLYTIQPVTFSGIDGLYEVLCAVSAHRKCCIIRGTLNPENEALRLAQPSRRFRRLMYAKTSDQGVTHAPTLDSCPRSWLCLDADKVPCPPDLDPTDPTARLRAVDAYLDGLAHEFAGVDYVLQWSSSAGTGLPPAPVWPKLNAHIYLLTDRAIPDDQLRGYIATFQPHGLDPSIFSPARIHYTAAPLFVDRPDPLPSSERLVLRLRGKREVDLPTPLPGRPAQAGAAKLGKPIRDRVRSAVDNADIASGHTSTPAPLAGCPDPSCLARSTRLSDIWYGRSHHPDRSTRDFGLLICLISEFSITSPEKLAAWLYALPGGKASSRGRDYAEKTISNALVKGLPAEHAQMIAEDAEGRKRGGHDGPPAHPSGPRPSTLDILTRHLSPERLAADRARVQSECAVKAARRAEVLAEYNRTRAIVPIGDDPEKLAFVQSLIAEGFKEFTYEHAVGLEDIPEKLLRSTIYPSVHALEILCAHLVYHNALRCTVTNDIYRHQALPAKRRACLHWAVDHWNKVRRYLLSRWPDTRYDVWAWSPATPKPVSGNTPASQRSSSRAFLGRARRHARLLAAPRCESLSVAGCMFVLAHPESMSPAQRTALDDMRHDLSTHGGTRLLAHGTRSESVDLWVTHNLSTSRHLDARLEARDRGILRDAWLRGHRELNARGGLPHPSESDLRDFLSGNSSACPSCGESHGAEGVEHRVYVLDRSGATTATTSHPGAPDAPDSPAARWITEWRRGYGGRLATVEGASAVAAQLGPDGPAGQLHHLAAARSKRYGGPLEDSVSLAANPSQAYHGDAWEGSDDASDRAEERAEEVARLFARPQLHNQSPTQPHPPIHAPP